MVNLSEVDGPVSGAFALAHCRPKCTFAKVGFTASDLCRNVAVVSVRKNDADVRANIMIKISHGGSYFLKILNM
jgi:hypothetical protein